MDMASGGEYRKAENRRETWSSKRLQHPRLMPGLCMRTHVCYTAIQLRNSDGKGARVRDRLQQMVSQVRQHQLMLHGLNVVRSLQKALRM